MLKTKTKIKVLLTLGIMILAVCVFNMNTVNAATDEELQAMLDVIPDEINVDMTELEASMDMKKEKAEIEKEVKEIWQQNNISTEGIEIQYYGGALISIDYFHHASISVKDNTSNNQKSKTLSVVFSNSNQRNSADEQVAKGIKIENPIYYEIPLELAKETVEYYGKLKEGSSDIDERSHNISIKQQKLLNNYYSKFSIDNSIKIIVHPIEGLFCCFNTEDNYGVGIFKNGVLYDVRRDGRNTVVGIPVINVPSTVSDDELNQYIIDQINKYCPQMKIAKITKGAKIGNSDIPNGYTLPFHYGNEEFECSGSIIVKREKSTTVTLNNTETNIKLETSEGVIPSNTVLEVAPITEGTTYNTVKTALTNISKFKIFDITLKSNGVAIQPNGKVKISIPVPTEYNKSNLVVYRVADNGEKTEYTVTVNGDVATFETDHFSTYVLAEKEVAQNTENTNNTTDRKKDDTPKTGTIASIYFMIPVAVISAVGIIAFRKKETK